MNVQEIDINKIKPYEKNAKKHDQTQINNVAESIKQFGFVQPLVLTDDNVIVIGHCRLLAAKKLKMKTVPCVYVSELSDEEVRKLRNLDNKLNESEWDFEMLKGDIFDLNFDEFDVDWGIEDVKPTETGEVVQDEPPEVDETSEPICKLGDMWSLGDHRLICGDSTDRATLEKLMNGEVADLVFTDPPYGMKKEAEGVLNDNLNYDELLEFNKKWIPLTFEYSKSNGSWYCWGTDRSLMDIYGEILKPMIRNKEIVFRNLLTWDKGNAQGQHEESWRMYATADEKCLFVMIGGDSVQGFSVNADDYSENMDKVRLYLKGEADRLGITRAKIKEICGCGMYSHWFNKSQFELMTRDNYEKLQKYYASEDGFKKDYDELKKDYDELKKDYDELKKDYDELKKDFYAGRSYFNNVHDNMNNVWHFNVASDEEREDTGDHATPKPLAVCARAIKSSSREDEIVLDVFGGSGSTLIACEQLGRKCYMAELAPKYCDVIIKRWEKLTGGKAVKIN